MDTGKITRTMRKTNNTGGIYPKSLYLYTPHSTDALKGKKFDKFDTNLTIQAEMLNDIINNAP